MCVMHFFFFFFCHACPYASTSATCAAHVHACCTSTALLQSVGSCMKHADSQMDRSTRSLDELTSGTAARAAPLPAGRPEIGEAADQTAFCLTARDTASLVSGQSVPSARVVSFPIGGWCRGKTKGGQTKMSVMRLRCQDTLCYKTV